MSVSAAYCVSRLRTSTSFCIKSAVGRRTGRRWRRQLQFASSKRAICRSLLGLREHFMNWLGSQRSWQSTEGLIKIWQPLCSNDLTRNPPPSFVVSWVERSDEFFSHITSCVTLYIGILWGHKSPKVPGGSGADPIGDWWRWAFLGVGNALAMDHSALIVEPLQCEMRQDDPNILVVAVLPEVSAKFNILLHTKLVTKNLV